MARWPLHNAVRVDEACAAGIAGLGQNCGHRVIGVVRQGARKAKIPLTAATVSALDAYLADKGSQHRGARLAAADGSLLATAGGRLRQGQLWELVRCLARAAGIGAWEQLSPRSLRRSAIAFALDAGASLRDVKDRASRKDPRTTRRYDHSHDSLDRNAAYPVAACLTQQHCGAPRLGASASSQPCGIPATSAGTSRMSP